MKSKITTPHNKDCGASKQVKNGIWETPWSEYVERSYFGDKIGRKGNGGGTIWIEFKCNSTQCKGRKIVKGLECVKI